MKNQRWFWLCLMIFPFVGLVVCYWALTKARAHVEAFTKENNPPIAFYGKLEDELGNPLKNATVNFNVHFSGFMEDTIKTNHVVSDASGLFTISGYSGESLKIVPQRAGYVFPSTNLVNIYSHLWPDEKRVHPDSNNPVVIKMLKLQDTESQ